MFLEGGDINMAELALSKINLVLKFVEIVDGKAVARNATLAFIRHDISVEEIEEVGNAMATLSSLDYTGIDKVTYEYVY